MKQQKKTTQLPFKLFNCFIFAFKRETNKILF
jgi:hypothetical protein